MVCDCMICFAVICITVISHCNRQLDSARAVLARQNRRTIFSLAPLPRSHLHSSTTRTDASARKAASARFCLPARRLHRAEAPHQCRRPLPIRRELGIPRSARCAGDDERCCRRCSEHRVTYASRASSQPLASLDAHRRDSKAMITVREMRRPAKVDIERCGAPHGSSSCFARNA